MSNNMEQRAPYPDALFRLVDNLKYKEDWDFRLVDIDRGQGSKGLTLIIHIICADTYQPQNKIRINHFMLVPPASYNEASWRRWLRPNRRCQ